MIFSTQSTNAIIYVFSAIIIMTVASVVIHFQLESSKVIKQAEILSKTWSNTRPKNMSYKMVYGCMMAVSYNVYRSEGKDYFEVIDNYDSRYQKNISNLFDVIKDASLSAYSLDITFNKEFGFPESIGIDWDKHIIDDECFYVVENFVVNQL